MGLLQIFGQAFIVGLSGALMPGPLLTYNIQLTYKKGFWSGPRLILGHAILEAVLVVGLIFGLGTFIRQPVTKITIGLIGGVMLAMMGYDLVLKESRKGLQVFSEQAAAGGIRTVSATDLNPVLAGLVISLSNPYWSLWWAVVGIMMITQALSLGWLGVVVFYSGHILSDFMWYSLISGIIVKGRKFISDKIYRWLLIACGIFLLFLAVNFIIDAIKTAGIPTWFGNTVDLFKQPHNGVKLK
jgi:threonine/homoserine/homoserine lactone efflux protein